MLITKQKIRVKPFLKWAGGKTQLINHLSQFIPFKSEEEFDYIEPFVGGGAFLFWIIENYPNLKKIIINDINKDLISVYETIKNDVFRLLEILCDLDYKFNSLEPFSEERKKFYYNIREKFNTAKLSTIEKASYFIFLNKTCFNGLFRVNKNGMFNVPIGRYKNPKICDKENLINVSNVLKKVTILNGDFSSTLKFATSKALFYLDPPYKPINKTSHFTSYTNNGFSDKDQIRLKQFCDELTEKGAKWILSNSDVLSNSDNNFFERLYQKYNTYRVKAKRFINSQANVRGEIKELIITNFKI